MTQSQCASLQVQFEIVPLFSPSQNEAALYDAVEKNEIRYIIDALVGKQTTMGLVVKACVACKSFEMLAMLYANYEYLTTQQNAWLDLAERYKSKVIHLAIMRRTNPRTKVDVKNVLDLRKALDRGLLGINQVSQLYTYSVADGGYSQEIQEYILTPTTFQSEVYPVYDYLPRTLNLWPEQIDRRGSPSSIVAFADTHGTHREMQIPDGKVLVFCGDCCSAGLDAQALDFIDWFIQLPHQHKLWVPGNHDYILKRYSVVEKLRSSRVVVLNGESVTIDGVKFFGHPFIDYRPKMAANAFAISRRDMAKMVTIPEDTQVLLTHFPPRSIGDHNTLISSALPNESGDLYLRSCLYNLKRLRCHIFGHIHSGVGMYRMTLCETLFVNTATQVTVL